MTASAARRSRRGGFGPGIVLALALVAPGIAPTVRAAPRPQASQPRQTFSDSPAFRIPFNLKDPAMLEQIAEVHLYVSDDRGLSWDYAGRTAPSQLAFPYRADHDGEYWFAVRTLDRQDRLYPPDMELVRPKLRVVVDTTDPSVVVRSMPRRGGMVGVLWEIQDENLDLDSFALEYQIQGSPADSWRRVRAQPRLVGEERWEVGTGYPVTVRVSVSDRAGNRGSAETVLPDGHAEAPGSPIGPTAGSAPPPIMQAGRASDRSPAIASSDDPFAGIDSSAPLPAPSRMAPAAAPIPPDRSSSASGAPDLPPEAATPASTSTAASPPAPGPGPESSGGGETLLVGSPRIPLSYDVENGSGAMLSVVEMWVTTDGGQTWQSLGTDPDRQSPFFVDLGGDGRYGLRLVVRSQNGLGDPRPSPGTPAQFDVIVDTSPPTVSLDSVSLGTGDEAGALVLSWRTEEPHPAANPVVLSIRPDAPDAIWQQVTSPMPDTGRFSWPLSPNVPARFFVRLDVFDRLGNQRTVETTEPVVLDIPRPRGRILGLDPNAGIRSASPLR